MLERFIRSINSSNLLELVFEFIWARYTHNDIASVMDIPAWESIDDALCTVAGRIREEHPERKLSITLSVVAPQSTDLGKAKLGSLFTKFREGGSIGLKYFVDYLPPVSPSTSLYKGIANRKFPRAYTPQICPCWQWEDDTGLDLTTQFFSKRFCTVALPCPFFAIVTIGRPEVFFVNRFGISALHVIWLVGSFA